MPPARAFRERGKVSGSLSCAELLLAVHPCRQARNAHRRGGGEGRRVKGWRNRLNRDAQPHKTTRVHCCGTANSHQPEAAKLHGSAILSALVCLRPGLKTSGASSPLAMMSRNAYSACSRCLFEVAATQLLHTFAGVCVRPERYTKSSEEEILPAKP